MTAATGTDLTIYRRDGGGVAGIGQIDGSDLMVPRLAIDHNKGVWVHSMTKQEFTSFTAILLCRVKGRIKWKGKLEENADPQCRSNNFELGFPNINPKSKPADLFPWSESNFDPATLSRDPNHNNLVVLNCNDCVFKNWGDTDEDKPQCNEVHTFAALIYMTLTDGSNGWVPVLFSIRGTGLKPIRPYVNEHVMQGSPLFTRMTTVTLVADQKVGKVYYKPNFVSAGGTDQTKWDSQYLPQAEMFFSYLMADPRNTASDSSTDNSQQQVASENQQPAVTAAQPPAQPQASQQFAPHVAAQPPAQPAFASASPQPANTAPAVPPASVPPPFAAPAPAAASAPPAFAAPAPVAQPQFSPPVAQQPDIVDAEVIHEAPTVTQPAGAPAPPLPAPPAVAGPAVAAPAAPTGPANSTGPTIKKGELPF